MKKLFIGLITILMVFSSSLAFAERDWTKIRELTTELNRLTLSLKQHARAYDRGVAMSGEDIAKPALLTRMVQTFQELEDKVDELKTEWNN